MGEKEIMKGKRGGEKRRRNLPRYIISGLIFRKPKFSDCH